MVWFIMAAIIYTGSDTVEFKINRYSQFNTEPECVDYVNTYDKYLNAGLSRAFPDSKVVDIRCVDIETIDKMRKQMRKWKLNGRSKNS